MLNTLTPEELLLFHEELAALVRTGSPLEPGLRRMGSEFPGKIGQLGLRLSERMQAGNTLQQALSAEHPRLPESYCRILAIGEETGKLQLALESLLRMTRQITDLRRLIGLAFIYPVIVATFAYLLFLIFLGEFWQRYQAFIQDLHLPATPLQQTIALLANHISTWAWIPPIILLTGWLMHRVIVRRNALEIGVGFGLLPGVARLRHQWHLTQFSELLAALVEQGLPLDQGLKAAADLTGSPRLRQSAIEQVEKLKAGELPGSSRRRGIPPYLLWILGTAGSQEQLVQTLRGTADLFRRRALRQAYVLKYLIPAVLTIVIGGTTAAAYTLIIYQPIASLLLEVTRK